jgi:hypothetical protein
MVVIVPAFSASPSERSATLHLRAMADPALTEAGPLWGAHRGYEFQDFVGAGLLAVAVAEASGELAIELPRKADRVFDDLELRRDDRVVRWQVKHSDDPDRFITTGDFTGELKFQRMVDAMDPEAPSADEYRILATWGAPQEDALGRALILAAGAEASLPGFGTTLHRLALEGIWPEGGTPAAWLGLGADPDRERVALLCARLVIELGAPRMSRDVFAPADAERWLISYLAERVGIGRFPNEHLEPDAAADRLTQLATRQRSRPGVLTPADARQRLQLHDSFGRLHQLTPVDAKVEIRRAAVAEEILEQALRRARAVVTAPPGAGKTWVIDAIERLAGCRDIALARHYCFLHPDDSLLEERVKGDHMVANLVAGVVEAAPGLAGEGPRYAGDLERLAELLDANERATEPREILLVVDGVDHVARIRARATRLRDTDVDLVERLASLELPEHAHLLVLSQPGAHIAPLLEDGGALELPAWSDAELRELIARLGLTPAALAAFPDTIGGVVQRILALAHGSPLYCTYLVRQALPVLQSDPEADAELLFEAVPPADADLRSYYDWLLERATQASPGAREIAILLAVADFALTATDIAEALPLQAPVVPQALAAIRPLLIEIGAAPGYRIHHESFQRYTSERLEREGVTIADALRPLADWLERRGLFRDARAFRHLLRVRLRSGDPQAVLDLIDHDFVARCVADGHPYDAVADNLEVVAAAAGEMRNWAAIAACGEHAGAAVSAYEDKLHSPRLFTEIYAAAHGADALAARLLFEGRPTWPRRLGLQLCLACDHAGGVPPWAEYLALPRLVRENVAGDETEERPADRAGWLGRLRLEADPAEELWSIAESELRSDEDVRALLRHYGTVAGAAALEELLPQLRPGLVRCGAGLEAARAHLREGDTDAATAVAARAVDDEAPARWLHEALDLGAPAAPLAGRIADPVARASELSALEFISDEVDIAGWTLAVRVTAAVAPDELPTIRTTVAKTSWFHDWMRFCVDEAAGGIDGDMIAALRRLALRADPYSGRPRAIDVYGARPDIEASLRRAARRLTADEWPTALVPLEEISRKSGAFSLWALLDLIEHHITNHPDLLLPFATDQIRTRARRDTYEELADLELRLARVHGRLGNEGAARAGWLAAARYLAAYGYHKDVTLFDLIESIPALARDEREGALERAQRLQPYATLVVEHTDGDETNYAPADWFRVVAPLAPSLAAQMLARSLRRDGGVHHYWLEEGLNALLGEVAADGDPLLVCSLAATAESAEGAWRTACERLLSRDRRAGEAEIAQLYARAADEAPARDVSELVAWAREHGVELAERPPRESAVESQPSSRDWGGRQGRRRPRPDPEPPIPYRRGLGVLLRAVRADGRWREARDDERFVHALGFRLVELAQAGERAAAARVLRTWLLARRPWRETEPLLSLAEGLERHNEGELASQALVYAWAHGTQRWWQRTGGAKQAGLVARALELDAETAWSTLAAEVARLACGDPRAVGITKGLVELLAAVGEGQAAAASWDAAAEVVFWRLPELGGEDPRFLPLAAGDDQLALDDALATLAAARLVHPYCDVSRAGLAAILRLGLDAPTLFVPALRSLLESDTSILCLEAALQCALATDGAAAAGAAFADELRALAGEPVFLLRRQAGAVLHIAGREPPDLEPRPAPGPVITIAGDLRRAAESIDWGGRLDELEAQVPEIGDRITARMEVLHRAPATQHRAEERARLLKDTQGELPDAEVRHWHHELWETALQEEAGVAELPDPQAAQLALLPHVRMVAAWTASRVHCPGERLEDGASPEPLAHGPYAGWWRIALVEHVRVLADRHSDALKEDRLTVGGVVFADLMPAGVAPLGQAEPGLWWQAGSHRGTHPGFINPANPFAAFAIARDPFGYRELVLLPEPLMRTLPVRADPGRRLALLDDDGAEAVRMRRWWGDPLSERGAMRKVPGVRGCDLIVRDDIWQRFLDLAVEAPRWHETSTA